MTRDRNDRSHKPSGTPDGGQYDTENRGGRADDVEPPMSVGVSGGRDAMKTGGPRDRGGLAALRADALAPAADDAPAAPPAGRGRAAWLRDAIARLDHAADTGVDMAPIDRNRRSIWREGGPRDRKGLADHWDDPAWLDARAGRIDDELHDGADDEAIRASMDRHVAMLETAPTVTDEYVHAVDAYERHRRTHPAEIKGFEDRRGRPITSTREAAAYMMARAELYRDDAALDAVADRMGRGDLQGAADAIRSSRDPWQTMRDHGNRLSGRYGLDADEARVVARYDDYDGADHVDGKALSAMEARRAMAAELKGLHADGGRRPSA